MPENIRVERGDTYGDTTKRVRLWSAAPHQHRATDAKTRARRASQPLEGMSISWSSVILSGFSGWAGMVTSGLPLQTSSSFSRGYCEVTSPCTRTLPGVSNVGVARAMC